MTKAELITIIRAAIERADVLPSSLMPADRHKLNEIRQKLHLSALRLAPAQFDENTVAFKEATARLATVNADLKPTVGQIQRPVETLANLREFVSAVDEIVGYATFEQAGDSTTKSDR